MPNLDDYYHTDLTPFGNGTSAALMGADDNDHESKDFDTTNEVEELNTEQNEQPNSVRTFDTSTHEVSLKGVDKLNDQLTLHSFCRTGGRFHFPVSMSATVLTLVMSRL